MDAPASPAIPSALPPLALLQAAGVAAWARDGEGRLRDANPRALELLGLGLPDVLGRSPLELGLHRLTPGGDTEPLTVWPPQEAGAHLEALVLPRGDLGWLEVQSLPQAEGGSLETLRDHSPGCLHQALLEAWSRLVELALSSSLETLLRAILDEAEGLTRSRIGFFHFVEADQVTLHLQAWSTRTTQEYCTAVGKGLHYPVHEAGVWADCLRENRTIVHNDYEALPHRRGLPPGHAQLLREMVVPLRRGGTVVAILGVGNKPVPYTEQDVELVEGLADLAWETVRHVGMEESLKLKGAALENSQNSMVIMDLEGRLRYVNPAFLRTWGLHSVHQALGRDRLDFWVDKEASRTLVMEAKAVGHSRGELWALRADGSTFLAEVKVSLVKDDGGSPVAILGSTVDITDLVTTKEHLQSQKDELELFFRTNVDLLCLADTSGHFLRLNPVWERTLGYALEELEGSSFLDLVHPEDLPATLEALKVLEGQKEVLGFTNRYRHREGSWRWLEWHSASKGSLVFASARDVTEERASTLALESSRTVLAAIFSQNQTAMALSAWPEGTILDVNRAWEGLVGISREEAVGRTSASLGLFEDHEEVLGVIQQLRVLGRVENAPLSLRSRGGERRALLWSGTLTSLEGVQRLVSSAVDITPLRDAEAALRESLRTSDDLVLALPVGLFIYQWTPPESLVLLAGNPEAERLSGLRIQEALGQEFDEIWPSARKTGLTERYLETLRSGQPYETEDLYYEDDRLSGAFRIRAFVLPGQRLAVAFENITARRQAEEALRRTRDLLAQSQRVARVGGWELDAKEQSLFWTDETYRLLDLEPGQSVPMATSFLRACLPEHQEPLQNAVRRGLLEGEGFDLELQLRTHLQRILWVRMTGQPIHHEGRVVKLVGALQDITQERELARQHQRMEEHVHRTQRMESLGSLAGGIAHDMNNVLGAILGLSTTCREGMEAEDERAQAMDTITRACERGRTLVGGLLDFTRQSLAEERILDLNELVKEEVRLLERTTLQKVQLVLELDPALQPVLGDPGALSHALMNLCVNAVDAMPEGGTLTLRTTHPSPGQVLLEVEDTGLGMSPEVLAMATDPFFTTKPLGKGTGLGLSIVYGTMKAHKGSLDITSTPGAGTRVSLSFPASPHPSPAAAVEPEPPPPTPPSIRRVLVVDDDELIRDTMGMLLKALGYEPHVVASGPLALEALDQGLKPDVIVLDMNMPGMDGAATLPRLRTLCPETPVLLATGRADREAVDLAAVHPGVTLLAKPFTLKLLRSTLASLFQ